MSDDTPNGSRLNSRFESVLAEIQLAEEQGRAIDVHLYLDRHPDLAELLGDYFRDLEWYRGVVTPPGAPAATQPQGPMPQAELPPGSRFAGYEIIKELGRGGMGIVYHARQLSPEREVALKVIRTDRLSELPDDQQRQWLERFRREAQLVASLEQHPNLVTLYEVGEHEGRPFFTMQLVRGGNLAKTARGGRWAVGTKESTTRSAELVAAVARVLNYVHQRGVLHRDLKPANILLDEEGRPLVSDFGLARRLDQTGSLVAGAIEGTAEYMAPEQARGLPGAVTTAADVYSLGAVLYALLTGRPPFRGAGYLETLMLVIGLEPAPPRSLNPRVPRDLEIICLKCLEKEPGRRYASAAALADDLENWLADRPISARPANTLERTWRWCRRNPVPAVAAATVLAIAVAAFALIADSRNKALTLADEKGKLADANGALAEENEGLATRERKEKERAQRLAGANADLAKDKALLAEEEHKQRKKVEWQLARETVSRGLDLCDRGETADGVLWLGRSLELAARAEATDLEQAARLNLAQWVSRLHPMRATLRHGKQVTAAAFSPDGRTLLTGSKDGTARLRDAATGRPISEPLRTPGTVWAVAFTPDGKRVVTGGEKGARLWDVATGRPLGAPMETAEEVWAVAFAADGRTLLTTSQGSAQLWDSATGKPGGPALARGSRSVWPRDVALRPDGKAVVMLSPDQTARLWDPVTGKAIGQPLAQPGVISAAAFSPDGRLLLTGSPDGMARLWQGDTGRLLRELPHPRGVELVAFGPDGRSVLTTAGDDAAWLWDAATGERRATLPHRGRVFAAVFSPDGRALLTGSGSVRGLGTVYRSESWGEARLWDVATGSLLGPPLAHRHPVECLAFSPDGRTFLTGNGDLSAEYPPWATDSGTAWLWQTADPLERPVVEHEVSISSAGFSPDGKMLVTTSLDHQVRLSNPATGEMIGSPLVQQGGAMTAAFSPDGELLLVGTLGSSRGGAQLWDAATGKPIGEPLLPPRVYCVAFSPDGKTFLTAGDTGSPIQAEARLWETATRRPVGKPLSHRGHIYAVAWSRDGRTILTGGTDRTARLWEGVTGQAVGKPLEYRNTVTSVALAPDGKMALSGSADGTARLCAVATGEPVGEPMRHRGPIVAVAFGPDGRTVLTGSEDGTARVWDAATGKPVGDPLHHRGPIAVRGVAFSPDGHTLLTACQDGTARLWEASTGLPVGPPWRHQRTITAAAFSPDGRLALTADGGGKARVWKVPPLVEGPVPRVALWPEVVTGRRLDPDRVVRLLPSDEWDQITRQLDEAGGIPAPPFDALDWHRREARSGETMGRWFTAAWHLGHLIDAAPDQLSLYSRRGRAYLEMGETERAVADYSCAIERKKDSAMAWFERGHAYLLGRQWNKAVEDLSRAISLDPNFGPAWHHRGYARAALGQWKPAAGDLAEVVQRPGITAEALSHQALICLRLQDAVGYRKACRALVQRSAPHLTVGRVDVNAVALAAWTCAVGPQAGVDPRQAIATPDRVLDDSVKPYAFHRAAGAALYRAGDFEAAIRKLHQALDAARRGGQEGTPTVWLLLAMAEHRLGKDPAKAREWLKRAGDWIAAAHRPASEGPDPKEVAWDRIPWPEQLALELFEREAGQLIERASPQK
jgi:WD40 repeat protein/tetratricopeptide (TPR) repeat protein/tRNA A-37 threonylcarbamoyl transferase component Bud32